VTSRRFQSADQEDPATKKYRVTLTEEERQRMQAMIAAGKAAAKTLAHARILLKADQADGGPAWPDHRIAEALDVSVATVERSRQTASSTAWTPPCSARSRTGRVGSRCSTAGPRPA
jgi:hypothetical protein